MLQPFSMDGQYLQLVAHLRGCEHALSDDFRGAWAPAAQPRLMWAIEINVEMPLDPCDLEKRFAAMALKYKIDMRQGDALTPPLQPPYPALRRHIRKARSFYGFIVTYVAMVPHPAASCTKPPFIPLEPIAA
jgi:hypothetical protein